MLRKIFNKTQHGFIKTWEESQKYELSHAIKFMQTKHFKKVYDSLKENDHYVSNGIVSDLMLKEFFDTSKNEWNEFVGYIEGKKCLDIGPSVYSPLAGWDVASERYVIEPLFDEICNWQIDNLGKSTFEEIVGLCMKADILKDDLVDSIDGAILCRNVLDHTPNWPFVLSNIGLYATKGCKLLLWTDLFHHGAADVGHYEITSNVQAFKRLVEQVGFNVIREYQDDDRSEENWGCFAEKY